MPFIDLNNQAIDCQERFDFIIIGAGAAGILLAVKLSEKGKKVLLFETGHLSLDEKRQALNQVDQSGKLLRNAVRGRKRAIGGTTLAWGGQSLPFSPVDFEARNWIANSGWPIDHDDLAAYYHLANRFMGVDELDYADDIFNLLRLKKLRFPEDQIDHHFSKWAPEPNFKKLHGKTLSSRVRVVYNASLTKIDLTPDGRVSTIQVANFNGKTISVQVPILILAPGALETIRILLNNDHQVSSGLGNASGWLGKCFMDHPSMEAGPVVGLTPYSLQKLYNTRIKKNLKYAVRFSLSRKAMESGQLLSGSASIMFDYPKGSLDPYAEIRRCISERQLPSLKLIASHFYSYSLSVAAILRDNLIYKHGASGRMLVMVEQEPLEESRISLSSACDPFGLRKANIHWKISPKTWESAVYLSQTMQKEMARQGLGELRLHSHIYEGNEDWQRYFKDINHHMGGARMSASRQQGVVNKDLQVWGHENLFVASAAVFPTGSHSNPTLTLLALSMRLSDFLTR